MNVPTINGNNNDDMFQRLGRLANESMSQNSIIDDNQKSDQSGFIKSNLDDVVGIRWQPPPIQVEEMNKTHQQFVIKNDSPLTKQSIISSLFPIYESQSMVGQENMHMYNTIFCVTMLCLCVMILFMIVVLIISFIYINHRNSKSKKNLHKTDPESIDNQK